MPLNQHDYQVMGASLKTSVVDVFILNNLNEDDMVEFVNWVFENKPREKWTFGFLKKFLMDWMIKKSGRKSFSKPSAAPNRSEENQFLLYLGEGYFDSELTKYQYWVGTRWRKKNLSLARLEEINTRQRRTYSEETLDRLRAWDEELKSANFDPMRQFYLELAASRSKSIRATLEEFGRQEFFGKFLPSELDIVPGYPSLDKDL